MGSKRNHVRRVLSYGARRLLEDCGDATATVAEPVLDAVPVEAGPPMPCPYATAGEIMAAGATDEDVVAWLDTLLGALGVSDEPSEEALDGYEGHNTIMGMEL